MRVDRSRSSGVSSERTTIPDWARGISMPKMSRCSGASRAAKAAEPVWGRGRVRGPRRSSRTERMRRTAPVDEERTTGAAGEGGSERRPGDSEKKEGGEEGAEDGEAGAEDGEAKALVGIGEEGVWLIVCELVAWAEVGAGEGLGVVGVVYLICASSVRFCDRPLSECLEW